MENVLLFRTVENINNQSLFTYWSIVHFLCGIIFFLSFNMYYNVKNSIWFTLLAHTLYELKDYYFCYINNKEINTLFNSIGDTISAILGIYFIMNLDYKNNKKNFLLIFTLLWCVTPIILVCFNIEIKKQLKK